MVASFAREIFPLSLAWEFKSSLYTPLQDMEPEFHVLFRGAVFPAYNCSRWIPKQQHADSSVLSQWVHVFFMTSPPPFNRMLLFTCMKLLHYCIFPHNIPNYAHILLLSSLLDSKGLTVCMWKSSQSKPCLTSPPFRAIRSPTKD